MSRFRGLRAMALLLGIGALVPSVSWAGDLDFALRTEGEPALVITPPRPLSSLQVAVEGRSATLTREDVAAGTPVAIPLPGANGEVRVQVYAVFADGMVEEVVVPVTLSASTPVEVDLSRAEADLRERTLTVRVQGQADRARVKEIGARGAILDEYAVELGGARGEVSIPFRGDPKDVVLLEVKVENGASWAGFTFSPWFLDIPHEDVLFPSNEAEIPPQEAYKLEKTLKELQEVLEKYGEIVPVKLYIAGCTDTVGSADHNRELSRRRAQAIARWLRSKGYAQPIYYHGFGEGFLAVRTGDGVDEARNRRAVYVVTTQPPNASSGVPAARWTRL